ncbi:MAG: YbaB/EbfC family nucleoid-associated protein [bacterium]|nr:YbaB/EbfC family nucleoid-associated protein [bacterium]
MFNKIKDLKNLRDQASQMKQMLAQESVSVDAIHGKITLVMDGNQEILSIDINPELLSPDNKEKLEQGIKEVMGDAIKKVQRLMAQKMQSMGGLDLPGM